jgi:hypothetical protein
MNYEPLMDLIIEFAMFLDFRRKDLLDEDTAVQLMEEISSGLQRLGPQELAAFIGYLQLRATRTRSKREQEFLTTFPSDFGLVPE